MTASPLTKKTTTQKTSLCSCWPPFPLVPPRYQERETHPLYLQVQHQEGIGRRHLRRWRQNRGSGGARVIRSGPQRRNPCSCYLTRLPRRIIEDALRSRKICFFHVRGQDCPFQQTGCRFSHQEGDAAIGFYRNTKQRDAKQVANQTSFDTIVACQLTDKEIASSGDDEERTDKIK